MEIRGRNSHPERGGKMYMRVASAVRGLLSATMLASIALFGIGSMADTAHAGRQTFNAGGTFNVPAGVNQITVEAWGAGGGGVGGAAKNVGTGGGGGGGYARSVLVVTPSTGYSVTVGTGGGNNAAGTDSTFDTNVVVAPGGSTGAGGNGGAGGSGGTGDVTYNGGNGANGVDNPNGYGGGGGSSAASASAGTNATDGIGAVAPAGGGDGADGSTSAGGNGLNGVAPGGGGGGSMRTGGGRVGGSGASGRVIVNWGPTVTINQAGGQGDPTGVTPITFDVVFSEAVTGFDTSDVALSGSATGKTVSNVSGSGTTYTVSVTASGGGTVIATVAAGGALDSFGNTNFISTSSDNTVTYTTASAPTVTINQAGGQADPTNGAILFDVVFSESVSDFVAGDVTITGTAVANVTDVSPASGTTFTVTVTGLDSGSVIADIAAGVATGDSSGLNSEASTSSDNTVQFDNLKPGVTINQAGGQADPTATSPILFDVVFTESVTGFASGDVDLSASTATANVSNVTGSGTDYTVEVTPTTNGFVTVSIPAGGATDSAGNTNNGSSSSDPDVEYTGAGCVDPSPSTITIPASQTVSGAKVDLTSLFGTTGNVALFTYTVQAIGVDSPWNSALYGAGGPQVVTLVVNGTDPDCGGSAVNDSNTITVDNSGINFMMHNSDTTGSAKWPTAQSGEAVDGWGITDAKYGQFVCETCHLRTTGNIKRIRENLPTFGDASPEEPTSNFPGNAITFTTTAEGSSDMGDDAGGHASSTRVCEACHSKNKFHNYDTANNALNGGDNNHANQTDCAVCHTHKVGFNSPGCNSCHGEPPTSGSNLVFSPAATGATSPASAGAHIQHAVYQGMDCNTCHKGNTMPSVEYTIQMGIEASPANVPGFVATVNGGTISVPNDGILSNGYTLVSSDGGTTVNKVADQNFNCTVYCHGNWANSAGSNTTPSWVGGTAEADCGTCHGADGANPPATGSHVVHASSAGNVKLVCNKCHPSYSDTAHLDGDVVWQLATADSRIGGSATYSGSASGSTGAEAPSGAFGNCANVYCHGTDTPTWGGATIGCDGCHSGNNTLPATHAKHYDSAVLATTNNTGNSTTASNYIFECGTCHDPASTSHAYGTVGGNQSAEIALSGGGSYTAGALLGNEGVFNYTDGTCGFNSCHNNGRATAGAPNAVAQWGSTLPTDCSGCHNNNVASGSPMATDSHGAHINDGSVMPNNKCDLCHVSTVDNTERAIVDKTKHLNGAREIHLNGSVDSDADPANNWDGANCTNVYCHSDGKASPSYQTIAWGDTAVCNTCHDNAGITSNLTAPHLAHIGTDPSDTNKQFGYSCNVCHAETAASNAAISNPNNHVNTSRDVAVEASVGGTGTIAASDYGEDTVTPRPDSCGTTNCHGSSSQAWSVGATTGDCSACHGMSDPGLTARDTNGDTIDSDRQVGAHAAHINASSTYSAAITCDQCHNTTYTNIQGETTYVNQVNATGHIDSALPAEISYGSIATASAAVTNYDTGTGVCANYCHGATLANGFDTNPSWDQNAYLSGTFNSVGDCNRCHGAPPLITGHTGSETLDQCGQCHDQTMSDGVGNAFLDPSLHIDGVTQVNATCGTCHGQLPPSTGSHPKHGIHLNQDLGIATGSLDGGFTDWNPTNYPLCAVCHDLTNPDNHLDPASDIMGVNKPTEAFADDYPSPGTGYPVYDIPTQTCTNARCHFQQTPDWAP